MRNLILAAAAAFALAASAAPGLAAVNDQRTNSGDSSSNVDNHCASILANKTGHTGHDVGYCASKR